MAKYANNYAVNQHVNRYMSRNVQDECNETILWIGEQLASIRSHIQFSTLCLELSACCLTVYAWFMTVDGVLVIVYDCYTEI